MTMPDNALKNSKAQISSSPSITEIADATDSSSNTKKPASWTHLIAGAAGGMATAIVTSPLDVLRTRLQGDFYSSASNSSNSPLHNIRRGLFSSITTPILETLSILRSIVVTESYSGLFRGLGPSITGVVPASAIKFYTYGNSKRLLETELGWERDSILLNGTAAGMAGIATGTATNPIWLVKTRLQLDKTYSTAATAEKKTEGVERKYKSSMDCVKQVYRQEGIKGFYKGLTASYLGAAETTLHLGLYEQMKIWAKRRKERGRDTVMDKVAEWTGSSGAAGLSKLLVGLVAYPHEVIRTRLRQAPVDGKSKYTGLLQCFRAVWLEGGIKALYGGLTPHLLRSVPSAAISLGVYEFVVKVLT